MIELSYDQMVERLVTAGWDKFEAEQEILITLHEAETETRGEENERNQCD